MEIVLYFLICLTATTIGAISGIGGGVIIKPMVDLVSTMPVSAISFLSSCTVLSMTVVSLLRSRNGTVKIEKRPVIFMGLGAAVGGVAGKVLFNMLKAASGNEKSIGAVQNAVMAVLMLGVFFYILKKEKIHTKRVQGDVPCIVIGLALGLIGTFLGIGCGPINLVVLYYLFSMDTKTAALHSLAIILFSQLASILSVLCSGNIPEFSVYTLLLMIAGGVLGGFIGRGIAKKLTAEKTDRLFMVVLLCITALSVYNVTRFLS